MEAQSRQLMEQSMVYQQHYGQYGYGQPTVYPVATGPLPSMVSYGGPISMSQQPPPPPSSMGYPPNSEYCIPTQPQQMPYDPSLTQMSQEVENPDIPESMFIPQNNGLDDQNPPHHQQQQQQTTGGPEMRLPEDGFNMQSG